jgi:hypothetical protein
MVQRTKLILLHCTRSPPSISSSECRFRKRFVDLAEPPVEMNTLPNSCHAKSRPWHEGANRATIRLRRTSSDITTRVCFDTGDAWEREGLNQSKACFDTEHAQEKEGLKQVRQEWRLTDTVSSSAGKLSPRTLIYGVAIRQVHYCSTTLTVTE